VGLIVAVALAVALFWGWQVARHRYRLSAPIPAELADIAPIPLAQPDALIISTRLRDLPRDLLQVPLLKTLLTEDFVFYYDDNDGVLGFKGALRRIAYEHQMTFSDDLLAFMLDQPADIALWHDDGGKLTHWMINARRTSLTAVLQQAAKIALHDSQLTQVGSMPAANGDTTPVYQLHYGADRSLLFAGKGDKLIVFSDASMLNSDSYGPASQRAKVWQALLDVHWQASPLRRHFGVSTFTGKHAVIAQTAFLSFHYQHFFPSLEALRFDFDGQHWQSYLRLQGGTPQAVLETRTLWQRVPVGPSLCTALPLDVTRLAAVVPADGRAVTDALQAPAAICWYPEGGLYSPLIVARLRESALSKTASLSGTQPSTETIDAALGALFNASMHQPALTSGPITKNNGGTTVQNNDALAGTRTTTSLQATSRQDGTEIWQRDLQTDFGVFNVTLARQGDWLAFSPQRRLVDNALAVLAKQRPALADTLPSDSPLVEAVITPRTLSALLQQAVLGDLPKREEPLLRDAAQNRLIPRLAAVQSFPPVALTLPSPLSSASRAWQPIEWQTLKDAQ
jgi:uncharacterized protein YfaA (DUF2138 family)